MGHKRNKQHELQLRRQQHAKAKQFKKQFHKKLARAQAFKLHKEYLNYCTKFNKDISILQIKIKDVKGDGSCLFRSFADQIDGNETSYNFMRMQACNYMQKNAQFFQNFLDEDEDGTLEQYVKQMRKQGQWGGHLQLQALCQCFRCIVVLHKLNNEQINVTPMTQQPEFGIIHLGYFQNQLFQHYVSIRDINDDSQIPAIQALKPLNSNMYNHLLYDDQQQYLLKKQIEELQLIQKYENMQQEEYYNNKIQQQPYPNYPRNKKCKCGSKEMYKKCCFKKYQLKLANKYK